MKRALPIALLLAAALAFGLMRLAGRTPEAERVPKATLPTETEGADEPALELPESSAPEDARGASPANSRRKSLTQSPAERKAGMQAAESHQTLHKLTLLVRFAHTHEPVGFASANITYSVTVPGPPVGERDESPVTAPATTNVRTTRMSATRDGLFSISLPEGARLIAADISGISLMLEGPRTPSNVKARFRPLHAELTQVVADADLEIELSVEPSREYHGVVRDARTLEPVAGAAVKTRTLLGRTLNLSTAADGSFEFAEPDARPLLEIRRKGYCPLDVRLDFDDLAQGAPAAILLIDRGLQVSGQLVDSRAQPISGVFLQLELEGRRGAPPGRGLRDSYTACTDDEGAFRFEDLPACEKALLAIDRGRAPECDWILPQRTLEPLRADIDGLVLETLDAAVLAIRVSRPDGTLVEPYQSHVDCEERSLVEPEGMEDMGKPYRLRVPAGVRLHLTAIARARPNDPDHMLVGKREVVVDRAGAEPREEMIVLETPVDYTPPPAPEGAPTLDSYPWPVRATLDLRLLDSEGLTLPPDTSAGLRIGSAKYSELRPSNGWIRTHMPPGRYTFEIDLDGRKDSFEVAIPLEGYARVEHRLELKP